MVLHLSKAIIGFWGEEAIGRKSCNEVHGEVGDRTVPGMLNLSHVLDHPIEHCPLCASPMNTLCRCILWFRQTLSAVLSTKLIPVHPPIRHFFRNRMNGTITLLANSVNLLYDTGVGNR